jgi:hypothetical protein
MGVLFHYNCRDPQPGSIMLHSLLLWNSLTQDPATPCQSPAHEVPKTSDSKPTIWGHGQAIPPSTIPDPNPLEVATPTRSRTHVPYVQFKQISNHFCQSPKNLTGPLLVEHGSTTTSVEESVATFRSSRERCCSTSWYIDTRHGCPPSTVTPLLYSSHAESSLHDHPPSHHYFTHPMQSLLYTTIHLRRNPKK